MTIDNESSKAFDKIADAIMTPFKQQISVIYIDADMLYDFRLGNLILHTASESQYQYIMSELSAYEDSPNFKISELFPKLGVSEEQLDAFEADPVLSWQIAPASPKTKLLEDLDSFLRSVDTYNRGKEIKEPVKLIINQKKVKLHPTIKTSLARFVAMGHSNMLIEFTDYLNWNEVPQDIFDSIDVLFVHDISDFVRHGTVSQKRMAEMHESCLKKVVIATYKVDQSFATEEETEEAVTNFVNIMRVMFSGFIFLKRELSR